MDSDGDGVLVVEPEHILHDLIVRDGVVGIVDFFVHGRSAAAVAVAAAVAAAIYTSSPSVPTARSMVTGIGVVHPPGERDAGYDGVFFRADEMHQLAQELVGKPLCVEHREDTPCGHVSRAWVGRNNRLFVLFETEDTSFPGVLAHHLVQHRVCTDLSLGHRVAVDASISRVVAKTPVEVSLCVQGARDGTHIYGVSASREAAAVPSSVCRTQGGYILRARVPVVGAPKSSSSSSTTMSTESAPVATNAAAEPASTTSTTSTDTNGGGGAAAAAAGAAAAPTNTGAVATTTPPNVNQELLDLVQQQQSEVAQLKQQRDELQARAQAAETKAQRLDATNKRKRDEAFKGAIGKWYDNILKMYNKELGSDESSVRAMFERMKEAEDSTPMVNLLACTAAHTATSTQKLEEAYQESKRLKTERDQLQAQVARFQKPALDAAHERYVATQQQQQQQQQQRPPAAASSSSSQWTPVLPRGMKLPEKQRDGMQVRNPDFWSSTMRGGTSTPSAGGMSWFQEPSLVGKEYQNGRKPVVLPPPRT